jgi:hypothetical protein
MLRVGLQDDPGVWACGYDVADAFGKLALQGGMEVRFGLLYGKNARLMGAAR